MAATEVILLERVEKLGKMGEVVKVRPGYARNFLIPQNKALRATKANIAYFDAQRKHLEAENDKRRAEAEKSAKKLDGVKASLIRQASEAGQLFGSVNSRDIADQITEASGLTITRNMVDINQNFKTIGLFPVSIILHPEVKVEVVVNIARTKEEAEIQAKTGRALIADAAGPAKAPAKDAASEEELEGVLEAGALEAEKEKQAAKESKEAEKAEKAAKKAAKKDAEAAEAKADEAEEVTELGASE